MNEQIEWMNESKQENKRSDLAEDAALEWKSEASSRLH